MDLNTKVTKETKEEKKVRTLPGGWKLAYLQDVCKIQTGKKDVDEGNPNGRFLFFTCAAVPTHSDGYSFDGDAILLPGNGANVGMSTFYSGKFEAYQRTYVLNEFSVNIKVCILLFTK